MVGNDQNHVPNHDDHDDATAVVDITDPDILSNPNVAGTGRPYSVVVVTSLSILSTSIHNDLVHSKRDYLLLGVHGRTKCSDTEEGKDVHLPCFKYLVASSSVVENVHTVKRIKLEE